jgi:integrase
MRWPLAFLYTNSAKSCASAIAMAFRATLSIRALYPHKELELDLALHFGYRRSNLYGIHVKGRREMAPLEWKDVDLNWKIVRFPRAKAAGSYRIPLNEVALKALKKLRERSDGTGPVIRRGGA